LVPVEPRLEVMLKLALGVTLGGAVTEEFEDGVIDALILAGGVESINGKGERGWSELVPVEPKLEVMFTLALGVTLGGAVNEEFEDGVIDALILAGGVELVNGKGERGWSELVPVEPKLEVMFALALGVTLGGAVTDEFDDSTIDALMLAGGVELVNGNGERGWSELVPVEPKLEVMFALALGVKLGGAVTDEFDESTIDALMLASGVELINGNGERGWSEFVPVDPMELVGTDDEALADGVMIPLSPVAEEVKVPPESVMFPTPPVEETTMSRVGVGKVKPLLVTFAELGGMMPEAPIEEKTAVDPEVERITRPDETVTFGRDELGGGISPEAPIEEKTAVDPEVERITRPDETVTFGRDELGGGISPEAPVDVKTAVDPPVERITKPEDTVTFGKDPDVELGGGIAPDAPVELKAAVDAPTEIISMPEEVITVTFNPGV
jgi:cyanate lyase